MARVASNTVYQFVLEHFKKERTSKKDWGLKLKIEASLYTLYWGFKKIPFTLYTYVLAKILQIMLQTLYKNWLLVSKITWRIWATSLSKKYIPSAKTLNTEDLSSITFSYLYEHSPNDLFHFWNHKVATPLLCKFLAQTLHTFCKSSPSKWVKVKVHLIAHFIFQTKSQFFFNVWIFFQCHDRYFFCTILSEDFIGY